MNIEQDLQKKIEEICTQTYYNQTVKEIKSENLKPFLSKSISNKDTT